MPLDVPTVVTIRCVHGANEQNLPIANRTVGWVRANLRDPLNLGYYSEAIVEPDREEWLAWARTVGIHAAVLAYIKSDATIFEEPESNPRTWADVSSLLFVAVQADTTRETLRAAVVGLVGVARGIALLGALRGDERRVAQGLGTRRGRGRRGGG